MTPRRRVTDHPPGPEMVQLAIDNLRARFPIAFAARDVQPVSARAIDLRVICWDCNQPAVVVANYATDRVSLCFPHAATLLESAPTVAETTRTRSEYAADRGQK